MLSIKLADIRNDARDFQPLPPVGGVVSEDSEQSQPTILLRSCKCGQTEARKNIVFI